MTTAPSTQPPDTLPTTSPSSLTAMAAPGSRGPEPSRLTTRATATRRPAVRQRSMSSRMSFIVRSPLPAAPWRPGSGLPRTRQRTGGRRPFLGPAGRSPGVTFSGFTHTTRWATRWSRCICSARTSGSPRSQPSERMTTIAPRAMPRTPHWSLKARTPFAEAGAARPVGHVGAGLLQGDVRVAARQLPGQPGEAGAEGEGLHPLAADHGGVDEAQQRPGVGLHRARDVEQQDRAAGPGRPARGDGAASARRRPAGRDAPSGGGRGGHGRAWT